MLAFTSYSGQCVGYVSLKINYPHLTGSNFRSPFGVAGALYSLCVWVLFIAVAAFQSNSWKEVNAFCVVEVIVAAVYQGYSKKRQTFSAAENRILLIAHVMKFNIKRAHDNQIQRTHVKTNSKPSSKYTATRDLASTVSVSKSVYKEPNTKKLAKEQIVPM